MLVVIFPNRGLVFEARREGRGNVQEHSGEIQLVRSVIGFVITRLADEEWHFVKRTLCP